MTIATPLSPAREHAFQSTLATQHKRGGLAQFSLPPVSDPTAPAGTSTPALGAMPTPSALSTNTLPIAVPITAFDNGGHATPLQPIRATPPTSGFGSPGMSLPIAAPSRAQGGLGVATPLLPTDTTPPATGPGSPGVTLPIAPVAPVPGSGASVIGAVVAPNRGNLVTAGLVSRLYQRHG
jgi:hypothetical protein